MIRKVCYVASSILVLCLSLLIFSGGVTQVQPKSLVYLQSSTPGVAQAGHANVAGTIIGGQFQGGGSGLSGLNASNLASGTVPDGRLSGNVALLTGSQTFTGFPTFAGGLSTHTFTMSTGAGAGRVLTSDSNGVGTWQAAGGGLTLPFTGSADVEASAALRVTNTNPNSGYGIIGQSSGSNGIGVFGFSGGVGVVGSGTNIGGQFSSFGIGVYANSASPTGQAVIGEIASTTGLNYGVYGKTASPAGYAVYGLNTATAGDPTAGYFRATASDSGRGVEGFGSEIGVYGQNDTGGVGVEGMATSSAGMGGFFTGPNTGASGTGFRGLIGRSVANTGSGVEGYADATSGINRGGYFTSASGSGRAVEGRASSPGGVSYGGYFTTVSGSGIGVYSETQGGSGNGVGGFFQSDSPTGTGVYGLGGSGGYFESISSSGIGVTGRAAQLGNTYGGWFESLHGHGIYATGFSEGGEFHGDSGIRAYAHGSSNVSYGVYGSGIAYGVYAQGLLGASGTKSFRIDHPFDPLNKYLTHYCAEGPEPLLIYSGTITTDAKGEAWVQLPDYFTEINKDIRYQLTVVEDEDTDQFVQAKVSRKVQDNRFKIRTSRSHTEVCWEVKGVRNDLWVRKHGAPVETDKEGREKGKYQQPDLYGAPEEMGMDYQPKGHDNLESRLSRQTTPPQGQRN